MCSLNGNTLNLNSKTLCCIADSIPPYLVPSNVGHFDAIACQDLHSIFEPLPCDLIVRHLAFEHSLVGRLDRQIGNVLQHLQLFFCVGVEKPQEKSSGGGA